MKIAVPITDSQEFSAHYGASHALACFDIDETTRSLRVACVLRNLSGTPCSWPDQLGREGVNVLLVGGMGGGARARCVEQGIEVVAGVPAMTPDELVRAYLADTLAPGENACAHGDHDHHHHDHDHEHGEHCRCGH